MNNSFFLRIKSVLKKTKKWANGFLHSWKVAPYVFVLPFILSFLIFWIYPLVSTVLMSFKNIQPGVTEWVGFFNYAKLFKDKTFHMAVENSFVYMVLTIILLIPFPMLFACLTDSNLVKAKGLIEGVLYLPALTSVVVAGTIFRLMFGETDTALMNQIMILLGGQSIKWLKVRHTGMFAMVLLCCWRWTGVNMLYFRAGLKGIDSTLYEAAEIDGASAWQKFIRITLPLLKPTTIYVITISVYAGLAMFLESYMLWNGNSSPRNIGLTIVGYLFRRGIEKNELGYASAVGLVFFVVALFINVVQLFLSGTFKTKD